MNLTYVYYNNRIVESSEALLSVNNRGLLFGESVFTSMRTYKDQVLFLEDHLHRLESGIEYLFEDVEFVNVNEWHQVEKWFFEGIGALRFRIKEHSPDNDVSLRVTVFIDSVEDTNSLILKKGKLRFFIIGKDISSGFDSGDRVKLTTAQKRLPPRFIPAYVKPGNYMESALELRKACSKGFDEILYLTDEDYIAECSTSNIFFRSGDTIYTPEVNTGILEGITRKKLIKFFAKENINVVTGNYKIDDLLDSDEAWLTSSVKGIRPVSQFEGKIFSSRDSWTEKIVRLFIRSIEEDYE
ncbi:MAG: aminotransferase class IV [Bacteriovoracaceae bacterium]|nr:aminotransferase class IV [Bacteriovoracaceae bacterium]